MPAITPEVAHTQGTRSSRIPIRVPAALAIASLLVLGCSSIIEGSTREVFINTNPPGAACDFQREGRRIGRVDPTPGAFVVKKPKHDILIECVLAGYQKATYWNQSGLADATFGNIVLGGVVGWAVDSAAGADNLYTSPVNSTLVPEPSD